MLDVIRPTSLLAEGLSKLCTLRSGFDLYMRRELHEMSLNQEPEEISKDKANPLAEDTSIPDRIGWSSASRDHLVAHHAVVISFERLVKASEKSPYRIRCLFFFVEYVH